jgi:ketosteroid isomerase-like protein
MTKRVAIVLFLLVFIASCDKKSSIEAAKNEIFRTEQAFEAMAKEKGLSEAFAFYADTIAVLNRGSYVIHGRDSIRQFYRAPRYKGVMLEWKPDFIEVSAAADLGYTFGKFTYTTRDSTGKAISTKGIFHTVWKKQSDGTWRFVWD